MDSRVEQPTMQLISEDVLLDLFVNASVRVGQLNCCS